MTDPSAQLEYAPAPHGPGRGTRRVVKIALAALLIAGGVLLLPRYLRHAQVLLAQRQFRTATALPTTQVIYENDPVESKKLLAPPTRYTIGPSGEALLIDNAWQSFYARLGGGYHTAGTVFVGELRTKDGRPCIISIDLSLMSLGPQHWASMGARAIIPGKSYRSPEPITTASRGDGSSILFRSGDKLRIYAAQRDPADPSHFTVDYDLNGMRHIIDGWMEDVGYVIMEQRN
jgi:hypothetical protein